MSRDYRIKGYVVAQSPNPPLVAALGALALGAIVGEGTVHDLARAGFWAAITVWAYEEAARGVNGFRRALGIAALVLIVIALGRELR